MAIKKKTYSFRGGDIIDTEEYHDGKYGAPGEKRIKRKKATPEEMERVNKRNKEKRCRQRMLTYFREGDLFATLTYKVEERPPDMTSAKKDFSKFIRKIRTEYKKRGIELYWIRNIEMGTRGAWHIHLIVNNTGDTASLIQKVWEHGGVYIESIKDSKSYDEDFTKLSSYMTKDGKTTETKKDGTEGKPRVKESNYSTSRNMPLPEARVKKMTRWKKKVKPRAGYYIAHMHEGINPATGYRFRRVTQIRLNRRI
ncbi:rolling circle replication-associated protein [Dorea formicigenerans]|uniref:Replication-associated protein ORF2/G2P domain-containing protein n=1 Tax=Dorea formicigenerans TaxID=39486 RepID=A0A415MTA7_9FIRM|nr:hypothetical protein [Dorea formicigenerans]RHL84320.1 hypothetical protein DWZ98_15525 [Dorea formicigenerans]